MHNCVVHSCRIFPTTKTPFQHEFFFVALQVHSKDFSSSCSLPAARSTHTTALHQAVAFIFSGHQCFRIQQYRVHGSWSLWGLFRSADPLGDKKIGLCFDPQIRWGARKSRSVVVTRENRTVATPAMLFIILRAFRWTWLTQALEAAHAFHTTRSPSEEDKGACAVLAQALADGSDKAEEALEVRRGVVYHSLHMIARMTPEVLGRLSELWRNSGLRRECLRRVCALFSGREGDGYSQFASTTCNISLSIPEENEGETRCSS